VPAAPTPAAPEPLYMKLHDFARRRGVSYSTVRAWVVQGMPVRRIGPRLVRVAVRAAEAWLDARDARGPISRAADDAAGRTT
jgi:phage terminase Nu1 subunit (DNA packaging protein)